MSNTNHKNHRSLLQGIAHRVMLERGLLPDFSPEVLQELGHLNHPAGSPPGSDDGSKEVRNLRHL
jgi:hypothetical protein